MSSDRCWKSQAKDKNKVKGSVSVLSGHPPSPEQAGHLPPGSPGETDEVMGEATGGGGSRAVGLLQLLHLAGQLFSLSGSYVRRGLPGLAQPLRELQDAKMPGQICQFC